MSANHFATGSAIVARLKAELPELRQVRIAVSLDEIADWQPSSPAAWVIWDGDKIEDTATQGQVQIVRQRWIVALIVRSVKEAETGGGVIESAGPLIAKALAALMGWQPGSPVESQPLKRIEASAPGYGVGYGFFPLAFESALLIKAN